MGFIIILMLTTLSIAGSAAFFSIYGLAQIFAGSFWPVVVMASSLEAGKLVSASYVYRYWKDISFFMKTYLISAIFVLMLITSAGIFGFLSAAYQTDTLSLKEIESQIALLADEKKELYERKKEIDTDVGRVGANYITKRMELIDKYSSETNRINTRIPAITKEIHKLKAIQITEESHVGPIIYIAKVFDSDTDDATKWMILFLIFAFDPLAVALTIATNNAMMKRKGEKASSHTPRPQVIVKESTFSSEDVIEPIDDLILELKVEEPVIEEPVIEEPVVEEPEEMGKVYEPADINAQLDELAQAQNIKFDPNIEDARRVLQFLLTKRQNEGLALHEQQRLEIIIRQLQNVLIGLGQ